MKHRSYRRIAIFIGTCAVAGLLTGAACPAPNSGTPQFTGGFGNPFPTNPTPTIPNNNSAANTNDNSDVGPPAPNNNNNDNGDVGPPRPNNNTNNNTNENSGNTNDNSSPPAAPELDVLPDLTIPEGEAFRSEPLPLVAGSAPLVWSLQQGPDGLFIDASDGVLIWDNPVPGPSPYTILVVVENDLGDDFAAFQLTVEEVFSPTFERLSVSASGAQGNLESQRPSVSDDGTRVTFESAASNLVPDDMPDDVVPDTNERTDVFLADRTAGTITRLNLSATDAQPDVPSLRPAISGDGAFVAFQSFSDIFASDDDNNTSDIFLVEVATGDITLVSRNTAGDVGSGGSVDASVNRDGTRIAFASAAPNLVDNDTNGMADIFVRDRETGTTVRVSVHTDGTEADFSSSAPVISRDGRWVAFASLATNLVDNDTNGDTDPTDGEDVFLHDLDNGTTIRVSVATSGAQGDARSRRPAIGGSDNELIAFVSEATTLAPLEDFDGLDDVYVHDRTTSVTTLVSFDADNTLSATAASSNPSVSEDGLFIAFESDATNLTETTDDNAARDVFIRDMTAQTNFLISQNDDGVIGDNESFSPKLNADATVLVMESKAENFAASDTNMFSDIFLRIIDLMP